MAKKGRLIYRCQYPYCDYETNERSQIVVHHIKPRELDGADSNWNLITLCPSCHVKIYIPESTSGIHSVRTKNSIIINKWMKSTGGKLLNYIDANNQEQFYFYLDNLE